MPNSDQILSFLFSDERVWTGVKDTMYIAWGLSSVLAGVYMAIYLVYLYLTKTITGFNVKEIFSKVGKRLVLLFALTTYPLWMSPIIGTMKLRAELTAP